MRHFIPVLLVSLAFAAPAAAAPVFHETLVHNTTTPVTVKLDEDTVLCSSADYGALFLKILIPDLAKLTLLDHQNFGAGAPCVAAGMCEPGNEPADVIDPAYPTAQVNINVKAIRLDMVDAAEQTCETSLIERVHVKIRGIDFTHERSAPLGSRPFADCATSSTVSEETYPDSSNNDDKPADAYGEEDDKETEAKPAAGCSAGGDGVPAGALTAVLGAMLLLRRRRNCAAAPLSR